MVGATWIDVGMDEPFSCVSVCLLEATNAVTGVSEEEVGVTFNVVEGVA